jgi:hypothetical protein
MTEDKVNIIDLQSGERGVESLLEMFPGQPFLVDTIPTPKDLPEEQRMREGRRGGGTLVVMMRSDLRHFTGSSSWSCWIAIPIILSASPTGEP